MPPAVVLGISAGAASEDRYKDTERNIRDSGEFVVNLVDEAPAERMTICAVNFTAGLFDLEKSTIDVVAFWSVSARCGSRNRRSASHAGG